MILYWESMILGAGVVHIFTFKARLKRLNAKFDDPLAWLNLFIILCNIWLFTWIMLNQCITSYTDIIFFM